MNITITREIVEMERCCSTDVTRECLTYVHLNKEQQRFEATNGHILSVIPCEDLGDLPKSLLIRFGKIAGKMRDSGALDTETGVITTVKGVRLLVEFAPGSGYPYPNIDQVLPTSERVYRVGLRADYLADLAKSLSTAGSGSLVFLEFGTDCNGLGAVRVVSSDVTDKKHGVIMPHGHKEIPIGLLIPRAT